ncbi:VWA domain-containing protein [Gordonibacter sp. 28C]|uniref:vWA domain-containing protein n=1 Tax=Gordonibacter sp. 28C TaxID=2078569 RepID=UPI000DF7FCD4|nr:VWA domain-containing protein [Gordonibacter sp. 28C]RDB63232.1 VWA domain-containing protein [Gordonibacter sp. 28C]
MSIPPNEYRSPAERRKRPRAAFAVAAAVALAIVVALGFAASRYYGAVSAKLGSSNTESQIMAVGDARAGASSADASASCPPYGGVPPYADPYSGEGYAAVDETGFVSTAARPLSTFSADVDTASYANLRRMVREGAYPAEIPSGAVRIEEMLNYFDYDYAPPEGDDLFGVTAEMADCPWNPDTKLLVMGFATTPAERAPETGANLVFLIDVSGSMADADKLPLLQSAFAMLVENLDERDRVSVVTYSGEERVVLEGASGADKRRILRAIGSLRAEGSTNGEAGLRTAYDVAERQFVEGGANRIVMASDGDLNVGMSSESDLHDFVDERRGRGVYLSVLGFGTGNYQDSKMETLADHGDGSYHYIDCEAEARRVLDRNLLANFTPLADDVKLQVEFNPAQVKGYRLIGYENRALADEAFRDDAVDAGEVGAGCAFTVAYEVVPADSPFQVAEPQLRYGDAKDAIPSANAGTDANANDDGQRGIAICTDGGEWLVCSMRYRPVGQDGAREQALVVDASSLVAAPSADWRFAAAVAECGMVLCQSPHAGTATFQTALDLMDDARDEERAEFAGLLQTLALRDAEPEPTPYARGR